MLLLYGLAQFTWRLFDPSATSSTAVTARAPESVQPPLELHPLLAANIFGQAQTATGAIDPEQLPLSSLNLVLTGVMARGPGSFAFLSVNGAPEAPVAVGQEITAGALLEAVYPDRVVLRRGVKLESVLLKDSDATLAPGSIMPSGPDAASGAVRSTGSGTYTVDRQALTQSLTAETLSQATIEPGAGGLVVRNVQAGSVFEKLGLRAGDVLRNINGQPVANLEDVMKIYAQFATAPPTGPIAVEVSRAGRTEILQYQMK